MLNTKVLLLVKNLAATDRSIQTGIATICTNPSRPIPLGSFWEVLTQRDRLLDELTTRSRKTRLSRTSDSIDFLKVHNVVAFSLLFPNRTHSAWHVSGQFDRVSTIGECQLREEVAARFLKTFPMLDAKTLRSSIRDSLGQENVAGLFDELHLNRILPSIRRKLKLDQCHKHRLLFALVGEMHWFAARTKATGRTQNNALFPPSDVLVLHSLCAHAVESITAELMLRSLLKDIECVRASWKNMDCSLIEQLKLRPRTIGKHCLSQQPLERPIAAPQEQKVICSLSRELPEMVVALTTPLPSKIKTCSDKPEIQLKILEAHREGLRLSQERCCPS